MTPAGALFIHSHADKTKGIYPHQGLRITRAWVKAMESMARKKSTRFQVAGFRLQVSGCRLQVAGSRHQIPSTKHKYQAPNQTTNNEQSRRAFSSRDPFGTFHDRIINPTTGQPDNRTTGQQDNNTNPL